jgi:hypothetical protein
LNIQVTTARQAARKASVIARLIPTLTSACPKKLQRKPLTRYRTGLNSVTVRQNGGSMSTE